MGPFDLLSERSQPVLNFLPNSALQLQMKPEMGNTTSTLSAWEGELQVNLETPCL